MYMRMYVPVYVYMIITRVYTIYMHIYYRHSVCRYNTVSSHHGLGILTDDISISTSRCLNTHGIMTLTDDSGMPNHGTPAMTLR